jgi:hypothetical protein
MSFGHRFMAMVRKDANADKANAGNCYTYKEMFDLDIHYFRTPKD